MDTKNKLPYAIVIGLDCITGLQSARILTGHDVPVIGLAKDPKHFCCKTKVCEKILQINTASEELISFLEFLGPTLEQKAVLFPCTDMSVLTLSRHRQRLAEWYHIALPKHEVVEMLMNKVSFYTYAQQEGLAIPKTFFLRNRSDAETAANELTFPCIMKPPIKTPTWEKNTRAKVYKIASQKEFLALYDQCSGWADLLMAQQWIEGNDANLYSCNCYFSDDSDPLVTFIARKIRQWPVETGTSCLGEEVRNDTVLEESIRLFRSVNYHGLGYVEMKHYWWKGELTLRDWWRSIRGRKWDAVFSWTDQAPFWYDLWGFLGNLTKTLLGKLMKKRHTKSGDLAYSLEHHN